VTQLAARGASLSSEQSDIRNLAQTALEKIRSVESQLGWTETPEDVLGIVGIDDAVILAGIITAGVAAVGYYTYKITTHTQDVRSYANELQAIAAHVLTPAQAVALHGAAAAQAAAGGGGNIVSDLFKTAAPYVFLGIAGYLVIQALKKRS
jgi:hypothetical protein